MTEQDKVIMYENQVLPNMSHDTLMNELEIAARNDDADDEVRTADRIPLIRAEILRRIEG